MSLAAHVVDLKTTVAAREQRRKVRERFMRARRAERGYAKQLRAVARQVGVIVRGFAPKGVVEDFPAMRNSLERYSAMLRPWANAVATRMVTEVGRRDETAWFELGAEIGRGLHMEVRSAPMAPIIKSLREEQVELITSLPTQAVTRLHGLILGAMESSTRADQIATEIMKSGRVTESRAKLIAITEVGRTATAFTGARAVHVGSEGYIWRTAQDSDVREEHRKLEGKFIRWDSPPIAGPNGMRYHAGAGPRCRCIPEPVIPDIIT